MEYLIFLYIFLYIGRSKEKKKRKKRLIAASFSCSWQRGRYVQDYSRARGHAIIGGYDERKSVHRQREEKEGEKEEASPRPTPPLDAAFPRVH
ncbi:hypothetical protein ALC56_13361 [Trachymyrmex septentrionalis]|uniref:Uncharacterized protein n=1 Tax=Trachymyrmex septentrionalis TaxID=34720 RepID=A0A195EW92_9HYME|nr:hypothetical protein ALC56_13361 [Trachymyrmex septentrionalis]